MTTAQVASLIASSAMKPGVTDALRTSMEGIAKLVSSSAKLGDDSRLTKPSHHSWAAMPTIPGIESLPVRPDPTYDVLKEQQSTNELLAAMVDIARQDAADAREDAASQRRSTRHALLVGWIGIAVSVIVGVMSIVYGARQQSVTVVLPTGSPVSAPAQH